MFSTGQDAVAVDVHALCRSKGIAVVERFGAPTSGSVFWSNDKQQWVIELRAEESPTRKRYTLAHELGHYELHLDHGRRHRSDALHRADSSALPSLERQANSFAADLLMPRDVVIDLWQKGQTVETLASQFQVSRAAMRWRLHNLGLCQMA